MSNLGFLALGYGLIWVLIGAYVFFISRKQAALRRHVEQLQLEVGEATEKLARDRAPLESTTPAPATAGADKRAGPAAAV